MTNRTGCWKHWYHCRSYRIKKYKRSREEKCEQLCSNKFRNLEEMKKILETILIKITARKILNPKILDLQKNLISKLKFFHQ